MGSLATPWSVSRPAADLDRLYPSKSDPGHYRRLIQNRWERLQAE